MLRSIVLSLTVLAAAGCALRDGVESLAVTVVGNPVDAATLPLFPGVLKSSRLLRGADGNPWLSVSVPDDIIVPSAAEDPATVEGPLHVYQLTPPYDHYRVESEFTKLPPSPSQSLCTYQLARDGTWWLSLLQAGSRAINKFEFGPQAPILLCGQRTLVYWHVGKDNKILPLIRRYPDGTVYRKDLPWPTEATAGEKPGSQFSAQGPQFFDEREDVLFAIDGNYHTLVYYIDSGEIIDLGALFWGKSADRLFIAMDYDGALLEYNIEARTYRPIGYRVSPLGNVIGIDVEHREIFTCDWDGVRAIALPTAARPAPIIAPQRVLDASPCLVTTSSLPRLPPVLRYTLNGQDPDYEVRAVPLDGSAAPRIMAKVSHPRDSNGDGMVDDQSNRVGVLGICQNRATIYTTTPGGTYGLGVSDGWLNGERFMERGRDALFSPDCNQLYFKEHAANVRKLGPLYALAVPGDSSRSQPLPTPLPLAYNVGLIRLLPDGRLFASTDLAVLGSQNRLLAIDLERRQAQALAWGLNAVTGALFLGSYFPGRNEVLVEVKDGSTGGLHGMFLLDAGTR